MQKEDYQKPLLASEAGVAVLPALVEAFLMGATAGKAVKKVLSGRVGWDKVNTLVEAGVSV